MKDKYGESLETNTLVNVVGVVNDRFVIVDINEKWGDLTLVSIRCGGSIWRHYSSVTTA